MFTDWDNHLVTSLTTISSMMTVLPDTEFQSLDINLELAVIYFKPSMKESLEREGDDWKDLVLIF